jgi:hypothetical protein
MYYRERFHELNAVKVSKYIIKKFGFLITETCVMKVRRQTASLLLDREPAARPTTAATQVLCVRIVLSITTNQ